MPNPKNSPNPADNATIYGISQVVAGGAILLFFGAGALLSRFLSWITDSPGTLSLILFLFGAAASVYFLRKGTGNLSAANGYRKVKQAMGGSKYISLPAMEQKLGWSRRKLIKSLQDQIARRYWPEACLDVENSAFMPGLSNSPYLPADTGNAQADGMLIGANRQIHELTALCFSIQDMQVKNQIEQLLVITKQIYGFIRSNPDKTQRANRFSDYHLPTAVHLMKEFQGLENQAVQSSSIQASMQKIRESMPAFESAFRQQLDGLYQDKALDISVEIKVLHGTIDDNTFSTLQT